MILATRNLHKVEEFQEILAGVSLEPLPEGIVLPPENGSTFAENALIKARAARVATGGIVIADDSGIEIEALGGRPGIRSARFAGEHATDGENLTRALNDLAETKGSRAARYVCVVALIDEAGAEHTFAGYCTGRMVERPRGDGGFGYDPAFVPDETGPGDQRTMAEISPTEKHAISHRGKAARELARYLGQPA